MRFPSKWSYKIQESIGSKNKYVQTKMQMHTLARRVKLLNLQKKKHNNEY